MLGIIFIYYLGRYFYRLAEAYNKHTWGYAILGVVTYYVGMFIAALAMMILLEYTPSADVPEVLINLLAIPFGLLAAWGLYKHFKKRWSGVVIDTHSDLLDSDFK